MNGSFKGTLKKATNKKGSLKAAIYSKVTETEAVDMATVTPDVHIPFNEGLEIERGYGNFDTNGNRAATFSRASAIGNENKSGVVDSLLANQAGITADGISLYGAYSNAILWSSDYTNAAWSKGSQTTVANVAIEAPDGTTGVDQVTAGSATQVFTGQLLTLTAGVTYTLSCWLWSDDYESTGGFQFQAANVGGSTDFQVKLNEDDPVTSQAVRKTFTFTPLYTQTYILRLPTNFGDGLTMNQWGAMLNEGASAAPYRSTSSTVEPVTLSSCSLPTMGNMPKQGGEFSIEVVCAIPLYNGTNIRAFRQGASASGGFSLLRGGDNSVIFQLSNGVSLVATTGVMVDDKKHKFTCSFADGVMSLLVDDEVVATTQNDNSTYDLTEAIYLGSSSGTSDFLNSEIKGFKIHFSNTVS